MTHTVLKQVKSKRQIMSALSPKKADLLEEVHPDDCSQDDWIEFMNQESEKRIAALRDDAATEKNNQQKIFSAAMVKLPKNVKSMTIAEFNALYKVDFIASIIKSVDDSPDRGAAEAITKLASVAATPKMFGATKKAAFTPSRTMRKGELLYSQNGSPVDPAVRLGDNDDGVPSLVATVIKPTPGTKGGAPRLLTTNSTTFQIEVGNGQFISLQDPAEVAKLDKSHQTSARLKLQILKEQVDSALQQLQDN